MTNRLAGESSPYLLQHAHNPVDWYPWGPEALERAAREDRPILLSIGYAACHWCHVMERESFENERTAALMNEHFVNIKVDREERPDLDAVYMTAVQAMTGQGGWPMTVFLTPAGVPFWGGTYFPPEDRQGMPSFEHVLHAMADAFTNRRGEVEEAAAQLGRVYDRVLESTPQSGALSPAFLETAYRGIAQRYDARHGGFQGAPKFPQTMALDFLLRFWRRTGAGYALEIARDSFRAMARGGIYDQVGGGFHRYSVDALWLTPHFEKMLYDNALLVRLGVHLWQATGDAEARRVAEQTIDWMAREMAAPEGGFASSLDADSEGEEGRFYVWSEPELDAVLGADAPMVKAYWGATPEGNFEGRTILHVRADAAAVAARLGVSAEALDAAIERARPPLLEARAARVRPARDDKVLASWNGLALRALAEAARVLGRHGDRTLALATGDFLFREMVRDGRVIRSYSAGTRIPGYLEDYAALALAALSLYELTLQRSWADRAIALGRQIVELFWDETAGVFFDTASDHERLITRPREVSDNATPSGTSLATELLLRLSELTADDALGALARRVLDSLAEPMSRYPLAFGHLLGAAELAVYGATELVLVGEPDRTDTRALAEEAARHYLPALVLAGGAPNDGEGLALAAGRPLLDGRATAYVCRQYACDAPTAEPATLGEQLERAATALGALRAG